MMEKEEVRSWFVYKKKKKKRGLLNDSSGLVFFLFSFVFPPQFSCWFYVYKGPIYVQLSDEWMSCTGIINSVKLFQRYIVWWGDCNARVVVKTLTGNTKRRSDSSQTSVIVHDSQLVWLLQPNRLQTTNLSSTFLSWSMSELCMYFSQDWNRVY